VGWSSVVGDRSPTCLTGDMTTLENRPNTWRIVPELTPGDAEPLVKKIYGDSLEDTTLETVLSTSESGDSSSSAHRPMRASARRFTVRSSRGYDATLVSDAHTTEDQTAWGARRRTRSSRTRTCIGPTRRRPAGRPGRSRPRLSTSAARPEAWGISLTRV
jgi:hypothetical protein